MAEIDIISDDSDDMRRSRKRSGDGDKNHTTKKKRKLSMSPNYQISDLRNEIGNDAHNLSGFGSWENHTTGYGSKMMLKMGYEPGKGLGRSGQGIITPIEAVQRKPGKGSVGYYGAERISKPLTADDIKQSTKIVKESVNTKGITVPHHRPSLPNAVIAAGKGLYKSDSKTAKTEYKTCEQIITESQFDPRKVARRPTDVDSVSSKVKIIDMSTSEVKVYTGYQNMYKQHPGEENGALSSLRQGQRQTLSWEERHIATHKAERFSANSLAKNLDMIIRDTADKLVVNRNVLTSHGESRAALNSEIDKLDKVR